MYVLYIPVLPLSLFVIPFTHAVVMFVKILFHLQNDRKDCNSILSYLLSDKMWTSSLREPRN